MTKADYKCDGCGEVMERTNTDFANDQLPDAVLGWCDNRKEGAIMRRVWSPPHTGSGSSGEPAR